MPNLSWKQLDEAAFAPLIGSLAPVASLSPDGRYLVFNSWAEPPSGAPAHPRPGDMLGVPSLRLRDLDTGGTRIIAKGSDSAAWRSDGALAYTQGVQPGAHANAPYSGHIFVRANLDARAMAWTSVAERFVVIGWARRELLTYRMGQERLDVIALSGPGSQRVLGDDARLIAVSPDGSQVALLFPALSKLSIVDVASGNEVHALPIEEAVDPATGKPLGGIGYPGDWRTDNIVVTVSGGYASFVVDENGLHLQQVLTLPIDPAARVAFNEPQFLNDDATKVLVRVNSTPRLSQSAVEAGASEARSPAITTMLECDQTTRICEKSAPSPAREWFRLVYSLSRPKGAI